MKQVSGLLHQQLEKYSQLRSIIHFFGLEQLDFMQLHHLARSMMPWRVPCRYNTSLQARRHHWRHSSVTRLRP